MPGKVNPVLCESVNQVAARVFGNDATVGVRRVAGHPRAEHVPAGDGRRPARVGDAARPTSAGVFAEQVRRRHRGRRRAHAAAYAERTSALATALNPIIGYERAAAIVHRAVDERRSIIDVVDRRGRARRRRGPPGPRPAAPDRHRRRALSRLSRSRRIRRRTVSTRAGDSAPGVAGDRGLEGVEQAAGAEAERGRRRPAGAHDRVGEVEVGARRRRAVRMPPDALNPTGPAGHVDRLEHDLGRLRRRRHRRLAGRRLDEVGAVLDGEVARPGRSPTGRAARPVSMITFIVRAAGLAAHDASSTSTARLRVAGQPRPVRQHDVDLVGAGGERRGGHRGRRRRPGRCRPGS